LKLVFQKGTSYCLIPNSSEKYKLLKSFSVAIVRDVISASGVLCINRFFKWIWLLLARSEFRKFV